MSTRQYCDVCGTSPASTHNGKPLGWTEIRRTGDLRLAFGQRDKYPKDVCAACSMAIEGFIEKLQKVKCYAPPTDNVPTT